MPLDPRDRLIVALDLPSVKDADAMVTRLGDAVSFYTVSYTHLTLPTIYSV